MTQFALKTHPARERLAAVARRWPGLWAACDAVRAEHPQPPECYLTDKHGALALVQSLHNPGNDIDLQTLRALDALGAARLLTPITTMACWRMTQGIYRVDPAVYESLIQTPLTGDLPADVLLRLPEWCIYVETPGLSVHRLDGGARIDLRGCFARIDTEEPGARNLVLTLDMPVADHLESQAIPLRGNLDAALEAAMAEWQAVDASVRAALRAYIEPIINLLLYICAVGDVTGKHGQPGNPALKNTRRGGWRLFAADGPRTWDVGVRMGAALRAAYLAAETGQGGEHAGPRGHIRRAHWHGFRSGPRKREDGTEIAAHQRPFDLRWLPPIPVNLATVDDLPATIRRV